MRSLMLFLFLVSGCGQVTPFPEIDAGTVKGDSVVSPGVVVDAGSVAETYPQGSPADTGPALCTPTAGCAACTQASSVGPGYQSASQCRVIIDCVLAGDAGAYPWQTCHNINGGGGDYAGLHCAQELVKACGK